MKKIAVIVLIVLVALIGSSYIFIPNIVSFNRSLNLRANRDALSRNLFDDKKWADWWPGMIDNRNAAVNFKYKNSSFSIDKRTISSIFTNVNNGDVRAHTSLNLISTNTDTTQLIWTGAVPTSYNPLKRVQIFFKSRAIEEDIDDILKKMQSHFSSLQNVYGYTIKEEAVKDSLLVFTTKQSGVYPSVEFAYGLIDRLKSFIASKHGRETGYPMLNVTTTDSLNYLVKVAIPVDKVLPSEGDISFKRMLGEGNILVVDVKGGPASINQAFRQVENYIIDYHRTPPAIPFLSLITDRRMETDTSKWLTRIYYPVM